jgi:hypothetical protein
VKTNPVRRRSAVVSLVALVGLVLSAGFAASPALASPTPLTLTVCNHGCDFRAIAPAIAAAPAGATIQVGPGNFAGGLVIDKNLTLAGQGASRTTISGGGPVVTIGGFLAATEPTVAIRGVTITGGITHASPGRTDEALGGGIFIVPSANWAAGATVTVADSVITGNIATPLATSPNGPPCPDGVCPFGQGGGGGIDSWGHLTVTRTTVSGNVAGAGPGLASDSDGGGIYVQQGSLAISASTVTRNRSVALAPDGRFAEGAGIMVDSTGTAGTPALSFSMSSTSVTGNVATLTNTLPSFAGGDQLEMNANAGGVHVGDDVPTTITSSEVVGNSASAVDPDGEPIGVDAGINIGDSPFTMTGSRVDDNTAITVSATSADVGAAGSALEMDGASTVSNSSISNNVSRSTSASGIAATGGAIAVLNFTNDTAPVTIQGSRIDGNITESFTSSGSAIAQGSGIFNNGLLTLKDDQLTGNVARAIGPNATAQGGAIWNGIELSGPPVELTITGSTITGNSVTGSAGASLAGGGLYTTLPVTITASRIAFNSPDQCSGTTC